MISPVFSTSWQPALIAELLTMAVGVALGAGYVLALRATFRAAGAGLRSRLTAVFVTCTLIGGYVGGVTYDAATRRGPDVEPRFVLAGVVVVLAVGLAAGWNRKPYWAYPLTAALGAIALIYLLLVLFIVSLPSGYYET